MKSNIRFLIRTIAFLTVFLIAFLGLQNIFGLDYSRGYNHIRGLSLERKESLDAVYIGASNVFTYWQPLFGWNDRGIAVWSYSIGAMPVAGMKHMLIEARKTQPNAVYIFNLNMFKASSMYGSMEVIHRLVDYLPLSLNKIRLINLLAEGNHFTGQKKLEFFFPIIRFHSRWDDLGSWVFGATGRDYKSSFYGTKFYTGVTDFSDSFFLTEDRESLQDDTAFFIQDLLDYCDRQNVKALFIKVPQPVDEETQGKMNSLEDIITARGYPCLDLMERIEDTGIQMKTDLYTSNHTNIHGSLKYCRYLADYLVEHYGFTDKRGTPGWESWDEASALYLEDARAYALPFELESSPRNALLANPKLHKPTVENRTVTLSWEPVDGAEGYEIFRLCATEGNVWQSIGTVVDGNVGYTDMNLSKKTTYAYRVVPFSILNNQRAYGNFDITGVSAKTGGQE